MSKVQCPASLWKSAGIGQMLFGAGQKAVQAAPRMSQGLAPSVAARAAASPMAANLGEGLAGRLGLNVAQLQSRLPSNLAVIEGVGAEAFPRYSRTGGWLPEQLRAEVEKRAPRLMPGGGIAALHHTGSDGRELIMTGANANPQSLSHELWHSLQRNAQQTGDFSHMPLWSRSIARNSPSGGLGDEFFARWYGSGDRGGALKYLFNPAERTMNAYGQQFASHGVNSLPTWQRFQNTYQGAKRFGQGVVGAGLATTAVGAPMAFAQAGASRQRQLAAPAKTEPPRGDDIRPE